MAREAHSSSGAAITNTRPMRQSTNRNNTTTAAGVVTAITIWRKKVLGTSMAICSSLVSRAATCPERSFVNHPSGRRTIWSPKASCSAWQICSMPIQ